ncbi:MAG TPA: PD-(D/E)XK nuclease family protein [Acidimicrobiales bacterium]|nr:PD-(D/E)XK nuclease family protein [Acidimicrobiales bacterium]
MALSPPRTLTPSKVTAFTNCPLAFRFSQIERLPEPPSPPAVKGTLVHGALEGLFWNHPAGARTPEAAAAELERAWQAMRQDDEEFAQLGLDLDEAERFLADARTLVDNYFRLEDPNASRTVGVELGVETVVDGMRLRGIIDRLDIEPDGSLVVVDYKTGRAPSERFERGSLGGVQTYALLCESLVGRAPAEVRLLYLRQPIAIASKASEQTIRGQRKRAVAVWSAIERACDAEDFRPNVGPLCDHCHFKSACPAFAAA